MYTLLPKRFKFLELNRVGKQLLKFLTKFMNNSLSHLKLN